MDDLSLLKLDPSAAIIVPTRSLASTLREQLAAEHMAQGHQVWEAPTILLWQDYLRLCWQYNQRRINDSTGARAIVSARQANVLWTQIIEETRRQEDALVLLDVQQTVRVVERSWRLMHDWQIAPETLAQDHVADTERFLQWIESYQQVLQRRGLFDDPTLQSILIDLEAECPFKSFIWYSYDLITAAQQRLIEQAQSQGVSVQFAAAHAPAGASQPDVYWRFDDSAEELRASLMQARALLEENPGQTINIVLPDLQHRYAAVQEQAREVFYPGASPVEVQQNATVYRFSLGQALAKWPAVQAALRVVSLLTNHTSVTEICYLLRNQFTALGREYRRDSHEFEHWLKRQRVRRMTFDILPELYQQHQEQLEPDQQAPADSKFLSLITELVSKRQALQLRLQQQKEQNNFAALDFADWAEEINAWLMAWGWQTHVTEAAQNSVEHQLSQRWQALLEEFYGVSLVQKQLGLPRMLELLRQMARDSVFQPQADDSPILISGVFEAIGRPADWCFLLGMDQGYPAQSEGDAFLPKRLLAEQGFPDADAESSFKQAKKVINSLLAPARNKIVSFSRRNELDHEIENQVSPIFRTQKFTDYQPTPTAASLIALESYVDASGPPWSRGGHAKGGSRLFELQSVCAFRAFVSLRLGFQRDDEAEFGLDNLDRGNVVHRLMELVWQGLQSQAQLLKFSDGELDEFISATVDQLCADPQLTLGTDKDRLLALEKPRLCSLLKTWLEVEKSRPVGFSVVETEEHRTGTVGGINFAYAVDRVDLTDDGRSLIIDYKTGQVDRRDWLGERLRSPQMPLYALVQDSQKRVPVSGITYAQLHPTEPKFVELCETDMVRKASRYTEKYAQLWQERRAEWPAQLEQLAEEFLAGDARVNPIDEDICTYCELKPVCRISQLRDQVANQDNQVAGEPEGGQSAV
ncbi:MAG: PD-(D/E)XK nuclease family protein [Pseudomonadota bacterium]